VNKYYLLLIVDELFFAFTASSGGHKDIVEIQLSKGVYVNVADRNCQKFKIYYVFKLRWLKDALKIMY
jgi:hypothetical protein